MSLTKQDIDALVDGMPRDEEHRCWVDVSGYRLIADEFRAILYLAAGLTAEGERKPEKVRAQLCREYSNCALARGTWDGTTFIPDGAT